MVSIVQPMVVFDERRAINRVSIWVALARSRLRKEWSREWLETTLRRHLRGGLITVVKVVEAADQGDEIADGALREVGAELLEAHLLGRPSWRPGDLQILAYYQRTSLRAPYKRGRGQQWYDDWARNLMICLLIELACKEFGIKPTRNRESRRTSREASGCSLVAAGLARNKISLKETTVQRHIWLSLPGELARQAFAERPIEDYFSG
jgi:hypothetical protein